VAEPFQTATTRLHSISYVTAEAMRGHGPFRRSYTSKACPRDCRSRSLVAMNSYPSGRDRHGMLQFAGDPMVLIIRDSLLFTASLWQAAVIVSCASPRTTHEATAGS
jgi:hypothetical protein